MLNAQESNYRRSAANEVKRRLPDPLRVDIHQESKDINKAVAKIQPNAQADDNAVKDYIKSGNKGGDHKGTHKNITEIPFDRTSFDVDDFTKKIENARK